MDRLNNKKAELYNDDCLEKMVELKESGIKVDFVLTDPPYNISRKNNFNTMGRSGIDFGEWDKGFDLCGWLKPAYDMLKSGGSLILFNAWGNLGEIEKAANKIGFVTKDLIRYIKTNPMPRNRDRRYITDYEYAIWFVKKGKWTFNRLDEKYQRPEFKYSIEKGFHPCQKPIGLLEDLIKIHTNENDLVLDCFMGSGSTGVACLNTNRSFIGIEIDEGYFDISMERINNTNNDIKVKESNNGETKRTRVC